MSPKKLPRSTRKGSQRTLRRPAYSVAPTTRRGMASSAILPGT